MTTTLKSVTRETLATHRGRALVLELHSTYMCVRLKGKRTRYQLTYDQLWTLGAKNAAEATRRERIEKRKARKAGTR